jgi:hypothetical protein
MEDFEVVPVGYLNEVSLSRKLMNNIMDYQNFELLHPTVLEAVKKLKKHYEKQMEEGVQ